MMKKVLLISLIWLALSGPAFSQGTVESGVVGITWKQPMQADITGWNIFASKTQGAGYIPISSVLYDPSSGKETDWRDSRCPDIPVKEFNGTFTIPNAMLNPGKLERFYFVWNTQWIDRVSIKSNEIYFDVNLVDLGVKPPVLRLVP